MLPRGVVTVAGGRILAATDESTRGRHAVAVARDLALRSRARLSILKVVGASQVARIPSGSVVGSQEDASASAPQRELDGFARWLGPALLRDGAVRPEVGLAFGVPGIEIGRSAELQSADLIVLGRRPRSPEQRRLLGETSDVLVRRSQRPVLAVPESIDRFSTVLVALDGTDRCVQVLECARQFADLVGAGLNVVTVEPASPDEEVDGLLPPARGRSLRVRQLLPDGQADESDGSTGVMVRRGDPVEEVLTAVSETDASVLVVGYRRGGQPKRVNPTEIARSLLCAAPCAVLTVPL